MLAAHETLESVYEEVTATEEELRQQYDMLIENQCRLTESEERMHHLAYHDLLTGLPNKLALYENAAHNILTDSSSYLTHLPISTLKIDKSFIDSIPAGTNQATLVKQIIMIGKRMNMTVIAEGVERMEQLLAEWEITGVIF